MNKNVNQNKIPKPAIWILRKIVLIDSRYSAIGDFEEIFHSITQDRNIYLAYLWIWQQVLISIPAFIGYKIRWGGIMFSN